jgi:hypothetical protein
MMMDDGEIGVVPPEETGYIPRYLGEEWKGGRDGKIHSVGFGQTHCIPG